MKSPGTIAALRSSKGRHTSSEVDFALMERARDGDRDAFAILFQRYANSIWRLSYLLLHSSVVADDAVQETFTRGLQHIGTYRGEAQPRTWFTTIALNVCRGFLRAEGHAADLADTRILDQARWSSRPKAPGVITSVLRREHNRALAIALGFLTPQQREAFVLHHVEEFPFEGVGDLMGVRPGTARVLAHRAKTVLRERLGEETPPGSSS